MIFIDYKNNPPSKELMDEGKALTCQLLALPEEKRESFIEAHRDYWGRLKHHLLELSNGKCWYTEAHDVSGNYYVDYFRPKGGLRGLVRGCGIETGSNPQGYWWLAFSWENYRLCGSIPNESKNTYFSLRKESAAAGGPSGLDKEWIGLLDPTDKEDVLQLTFGEDGRAYPACSDDACWEAQRAFLSIQVYNLNAQQLIDARIEVQNKCKRIVHRIMRLMQDKENNNNGLAHKEIRALIRELRGLIHPQSELSSVAKSYLLSRPEPFIQKIASA